MQFDFEGFFGGFLRDSFTNSSDVFKESSRIPSPLLPATFIINADPDATLRIPGRIHAGLVKPINQHPIDRTADTTNSLPVCVSVSVCRCVTTLQPRHLAAFGYGAPGAAPAAAPN